MYRIHQLMLKDVAEILSVIANGERFLNAKFATNSPPEGIDRDSDEGAATFIGVLGAYLAEMKTLIEMQEREINFLYDALDTAEKVGDEMGKIIAESVMFPTNDDGFNPEPPF